MPPVAVKSTRVVQRGIPDFVQAINDDYQAQISHTFILHGNIYDFVDNKGNDLSLRKVLAASMDDNIRKGLNPAATCNNQDGGVQTANRRTSPKTRILAFYNTSTGLDFPDSKSLTAWKAAFKEAVGDERFEAMEEENHFQPGSPESAMALFSEWFAISKKALQDNKMRRENGETLHRELVFTLVLTDADTLVPRGDVSNMGADRGAIVHLRNWAQDRDIGDRNRIILVTRHLMDIHESIRTELAVSHPVRKPNLQDRLDWITNFNLNIKGMVEQNGPQVSGQNTNIREIDFAPEFTMNDMALQSAGMNRRQIKDVILNSWRNLIPVDFPLVQERKKRALFDEYGGMLDIIEGTFGFEQIGGHAHFKDFALWEVVKPLKSGIKKLCTAGAIMLGPPGTGKTMLALALAKEAGLNFISVDIGVVFGGLVGESEKNTRKLIEAIEAAAPCIVFLDEVDSSMSSGRTSQGDSGTAGRVFGNFMRWLSDPSRIGKVVVFMASNRPDLLDSALIREGRIDAKIPLLPPVKGDAKGRWAILSAQTRKHKIVLSPELEASKTDPKGLGMMLMDTKRYWTGAEIEGALKSALRRAARAERMLDGKPDLRITIEDWAYVVARSSATGDVDLQINLALEFASPLYIPDEWTDMANDVKARAADRKQRLAEAA
jgi:hypothetical protein